jgi:hypothetical protein
MDQGHQARQGTRQNTKNTDIKLGIFCVPNYPGFDRLEGDILGVVKGIFQCISDLWRLFTFCIYQP